MRHLGPLSLRLCLLTSPLVVGCGPSIYLSDDEGGPRANGSLVSGHPNELSSPYALGTRLLIAVHGTSQDMTGWQLRSDAPDVLRVDGNTVQEKVLTATCTAAAEGQTVLRLLDAKGGEVRSGPVVVKTPDRARLFAHGPLRLLDRKASALAPSEIKEARILSGGKAVFAVAYFKGDERLFGHGIATIDSPGQLKVEAKTTAGVVVNEWLFVTPASVGNHELKVTGNGRPLATIPIVGVAEGEVASLALAEERTDQRKDDQQIFVLAQARDAMGRDLFGVYTDWTLGGVAQPGPEENPKASSGDLFRYTFASAVPPQDLVASRGGLKGTLAIRARKGFVTNTIYLGCSAAPSRPSRGAGALLAAGLVVAALAGRRRRA